MKKTTAVLLALLVAMAALSATVCAAEIDLIPADADLSLIHILFTHKI